MARYETQIQSLKSDRQAVNGKLSEKLSQTVSAKFSEMAGKIREIEAGRKYTVIVDFTGYTGSRYGHRIAFSIYENNKSGKKVLSINEDKTTQITNTYEYTFTTNANQIYIDNSDFAVYYYAWSAPAYSLPRNDSVTLSNLKQHSKIRIVGTRNSDNNGAIAYAD